MKIGTNAGRCIYRACRTGLGGCNYIGVEGHSRGCTVENCAVYVKGRKKKESIVVGE